MEMLSKAPPCESSRYTSPKASHNAVIILLLLVTSSHGNPFTPDQTNIKDTSKRASKAPVDASFSGSHVGNVDTDRTDKHDRAERDIECADSPSDAIKPCILCNGEVDVEMTDDKGYTCRCSFCTLATTVTNRCRCNANGGVEADTECDVVPVGMGYMPYPNICEQFYLCSKCSGDLKSIGQCGPIKDTKCACPTDSYQTGPLTCVPKPLCLVDHQQELIQNPGSKYTSYKCVPCPDGTHQPFNNSAELCRPKVSSTSDSPNQDVQTSTVSPDLQTSTKSTSALPYSDHTTSGICKCPVQPACPTQPTTDTQSILLNLCNAGVWIVVLLCIPLAFLLGRRPNDICKVIKWLIRCCSGDRGSYEVADDEGETNELQDLNRPMPSTDETGSNGHHIEAQ